HHPARRLSHARPASPRELMEHPLTIVGGGLTGLSLGIALRRSDIEVRVCEAGSYPRHRVCGEFISGISPDTQTALGITGAFAPQTINHDSEWFYRDRPALRKTLPSPAIGISRYHLDQWLAGEFVRLGGDLQTGSRVRPDDLPAEASIWCDGRRRHSGGGWLGLKCHARDFELATDLQMHFGKDCYVGVSRIEDGRVNICGLFRQQRGLSSSDRRELLLRYLRAGQLGRLAGEVASATIDPDSLLGVSAFRLGHQPDRPGSGSDRLNLGDAESMIPPFTGNGMTMAFQSAEIATAPLVEYARGTLTWNEATQLIRREHSRRFQHRLRWAMKLHPWLLRSSGQRTLVALTRAKLIPFSLLFKQTR
ncbi:MAG: NAD(P)/FAD-dependent oxidoreductase, partial [Verrucomicrobiales bacterium]